MFADTILPALDAGLQWRIIYGPTNVELLVTTPGGQIPGDYNGDNTVNAADYVVWHQSIGTQSKYDEWRANFGDIAVELFTTIPCDAGDFNGDGAVDAADYVVWHQNLRNASEVRSMAGDFWRHCAALALDRQRPGSGTKRTCARCVGRIVCQMRAVPPQTSAA